MAATPSITIAPAATQFADGTRHRIALRLLPFLFVLYLANYVDRTNLAYAALRMSRDLGFSDRVFGLGAGIFTPSAISILALDRSPLAWA